MSINNEKHKGFKMKRKLATLESRLSNLQKKAGLTPEEIDSMNLGDLYAQFQKELEFFLKSSFKNIKVSNNSFKITLPFMNGEIVAKYSYGITQKSIEHNMISFENKGFLHIDANFMADGMFDKIIDKKMPISVYSGIGFMNLKSKTNAFEIVSKLKNQINYFFAMQDLPSAK